MADLPDEPTVDERIAAREHLMFTKPGYVAGQSELTPEEVRATALAMRPKKPAATPAAKPLGDEFTNQ
jgi:hypothetical protein